MMIETGRINEDFIGNSVNLSNIKKKNTDESDSIQCNKQLDNSPKMTDPVNSLLPV
jgi:hypothetical protein